ncbi:MAG: hypothetical protein U1F20_08945 [Lysobacterales bacterium]
MAMSFVVTRAEHHLRHRRARPTNSCAARPCRSGEVEHNVRVDILGWPADPALQAAAAKLLHDPDRLACCSPTATSASALFRAPAQQPLGQLPVAGLEAANARLGLALAPDEIDYLRER